MFRRAVPLFVSSLAVAACGAAPRAYAADLFSPDTLSGVIVSGLSAGSGGPSWLKGGLGKVSTGDGQARLDGQAIIAWRGRFSEHVGALVSLDAQSLADSVVGVDESYLTLRSSPGDAVQISGRAGLFFPPVSLEHDGSEWSLVNTLTPSAINTWIAEEVKVAGIETTFRGALADHAASVTVAAFQGNDTSGALMTFRGWALHDLRANLGRTFALPPPSAMFAGKQSPRTRPVDEVDGRWGAYGRVEVAPTDTTSVSLFAYDNNGDRTTVTDGQYAWRTRFAQMALRWSPNARIEVLAQAMTGETAMGVSAGGLEPADVGFTGFYVLVAQQLSRGAAAVRIDQFSVTDRSFKATDNNAEQGWAATVAWRVPASVRSEVVFEGIATNSSRRDRARFGQAMRQDSLQARAAFRSAF